MVRARRFASIAIVTVVGLLALTGCRSDPAVAAYVGGTRILDTKVVQIVEEVLGKLPAEQRASIDAGALRDQVVQLLVVRAVVDYYADENDLTVPEPDADAFAQEQGLPTGVEFTTVAAEFNAGLSALSSRATSVAPTEADQREAYDHAEYQNQLISTQATFDEVRQILNEQALGSLLGLRKLIVGAADDADVTINPRYNVVFRLPVQIQASQEQQQVISSWFAVTLGGSAPVRDLPLPVTSQGASGQE